MTQASHSVDGHWVAPIAHLQGFWQCLLGSCMRRISCKDLWHPVLLTRQLNVHTVLGTVHITFALCEVPAARISTDCRSYARCCSGVRTTWRPTSTCARAASRWSGSAARRPTCATTLWTAGSPPGGANRCERWTQSSVPGPSFHNTVAAVLPSVTMAALGLHDVATAAARSPDA